MSDRRETFESVSRKNVGRNALDASLEVNSVNVTEWNVDLCQASTLVYKSVRLEGKTVTAVVVSLTTARNINALSDILAVSLGRSAQASAGDAIMEIGTSGRNVIALIVDGAPGSSNDES